MKAFDSRSALCTIITEIIFHHGPSYGSMIVKRAGAHRLGPILRRRAGDFLDGVLARSRDPAYPALRAA